MALNLIDESTLPRYGLGTLQERAGTMGRGELEFSFIGAAGEIDIWIAVVPGKGKTPVSMLQDSCIGAVQGEEGTMAMLAAVPILPWDFFRDALTNIDVDVLELAWMSVYRRYQHQHTENN
jgi:hypothetical protein